MGEKLLRDAQMFYKKWNMLELNHTQRMQRKLVELFSNKHQGHTTGPGKMYGLSNSNDQEAVKTIG